MSSRINPDFTPDERSYANLRKHGVLPDFIDDQLDTFKTYWLEKGEKKASWQMTLQVWMRRSYKGRAGKEWEENRHIRERYSNKPKGDLFSGVLDKIADNMRTSGELKTETVNMAKDEYPPFYATRIQHSPIPGEGETMSSDEAFRELRKIMK